MNKKIEINLINTTSSQWPEDLIRKAGEFVLERLNKQGKINIIAVGPRKMRKLNRYFRGKNRVTDVLSFSYSVDLSHEPYRITEEETGEIVLCLREIKKRAKRFGTEFENLLVETLIHGLLHLFGYDHKNPKQAKEMFAKQKELLESFRA